MLKVAWTPFESQDKAELRAYRKLTISVPYVIINKTGAHLIFKQAARLGGLLGQSKDAHVPVNASSLRTADMQLILFSYGKFELLTKQGVTFRTADSEWSAVMLLFYIFVFSNLTKNFCIDCYRATVSKVRARPLKSSWITRRTLISSTSLEWTYVLVVYEISLKSIRC